MEGNSKNQQTQRGVVRDLRSLLNSSSEGQNSVEQDFEVTLRNSNVHENGVRSKRNTGDSVLCDVDQFDDEIDYDCDDDEFPDIQDNQLDESVNKSNDNKEVARNVGSEIVGTSED